VPSLSYRMSYTEKRPGWPTRTRRFPRSGASGLSIKWHDSIKTVQKPNSHSLTTSHGSFCGEYPRLKLRNLFTPNKKETSRMANACPSTQIGSIGDSYRTWAEQAVGEKDLRREMLFRNETDIQTDRQTSCANSRPFYTAAPKAGRSPKSRYPYNNRNRIPLVIRC
jgi:hypothetical protein